MKISVLMQRGDPPPAHYTIGPLLEEWRAQGHETEVLHGVGQPIRGDIVFLHIDLTVVPDEVLRAVEGHPMVVNRRLTDISKHRFSRIRVRSAGEWSGPVIVKTVRNHGGYPERRLRRSTILGRLRNVAEPRAGLEPMSVADSIHPFRYPVYPSARDVPRGVFTNRALIVERFLPERAGDLYVMRLCRCLGESVVCERFESPDRMIRVDWRGLPDVVPLPQSVAWMRRDLGLDYGKLDWVMCDGEPVVIDVSRTPAVAQTPERLRRHVVALAPGLADLVSARTG